MQSTLSRLVQLTFYGVLSGFVAAAVALLGALLFQHHLTRSLVGTALGWGGIALCIAAGAIAYSENSLGIAETQMRARLGEAYRPAPLPLAQILIPLIGAGILFMAQMLLR